MAKGEKPRWKVYLKKKDSAKGEGFTDVASIWENDNFPSGQINPDFLSLVRGKDFSLEDYWVNFRDYGTENAIGKVADTVDDIDLE